MSDNIDIETASDIYKADMLKAAEITDKYFRHEAEQEAKRNELKRQDPSAKSPSTDDIPNDWPTPSVMNCQLPAIKMKPGWVLYYGRYHYDQDIYKQLLETGANTALAKIEDNVGIPTRSSCVPLTEEEYEPYQKHMYPGRYPFKEMKPGQSIVAPLRIRSQVHSLTRKIEYDFMLRQINATQVRIWCLG